PVEELHLEGERLGQSFRHLEAIVNDAGGSRRDLVVVERDEDVLRVPAIDPLAVTIEKIDVHEVGPRIDVAAVVEPTAPSDDAIAGLDGHIEPDVVRVARSLREVMADLQRADEDLEKIAATGLENRHLGTDRRGQLAVDPAVRLDAEEVDPKVALVELLVRLLHPRR